MPQSSQVLYRLANAVQVVNPDVDNAGSIGSDVNEDQGYLSEPKMPKQRLLHAKGQDRHALDTAFDHTPHGLLHSLRVVHGGGKKNLVIVLHCEMFKGLNNFREKRVGNLGYDQAQDAASSDTKARAWVLGKYPSSSTTFQTRLASRG